MDYRYTEAVISNKRLKQECQIHEICLLNVYNIMSTGTAYPSGTPEFTPGF
jgi:hypothetical protein